VEAKALLLKKLTPEELAAESVKPDEAFPEAFDRTEAAIQYLQSCMRRDLGVP